ncbi:hypothetical protein Tco_1006422 [Tanacetum coccineum]|uniref:Uncharacterized protein n=1 Tax=Tanacetum coccineum TaxID=301880 RepID=A0ABQ5FIK1_9ASTR
MKDNLSQEHVCEEEVPLNNNIGKVSHDLIEMPSDAVDQGMDDHVPDEIDGVECYTHFDASIGGKKGNLEFEVWKHVPNHGGDELMHLLLNPSHREELDNEERSQEELAVIQVEFAVMVGQMQQLKE